LVYTDNNWGYIASDFYKSRGKESVVYTHPDCHHHDPGDYLERNYNADTRKKYALTMKITHEREREMNKKHEQKLNMLRGMTERDTKVVRGAMFLMLVILVVSIIFFH